VRDLARRGRSVTRSIGLVGVSMNRYFVFGRDRRLDQLEARGVHVGEVEPELAPHRSNSRNVPP
jgi:hypothetical protein